MAELTFTSEITVEHIDHMGHDQRIVEAMLVSTKGLDAAEAASKSIEGRIGYLMKERHGAPFEHGALTVRIHAPAVAWWEHVRHRAGWSYSIESARFRDMVPTFYIPPRERRAVRPMGFKSARPAFAHATDDEYEMMVDSLKRGYVASHAEYEYMLSLQIDRGLARDVLGFGLYFAGYCTCNPRSLMHLLELRTTEEQAKRPSKPLYEIEVVARRLEDIFAEQWPVTHRLWNEHGRMCP